MERRMRDPDLGPYEDWGDAELVVLSRDEPEAFGVVFERYAEDLLRYFAKRTLDPEAAAELVAETFAEAFASRRRFRDRGLGAGGWVYGIGRHQVGRAIGQAFAFLSEEQREALTLRVVEGRSYREVAEELRCTEETARARVSRGLKRLARSLETPLETEPGREGWTRRSVTCTRCA